MKIVSGSRCFTMYVGAVLALDAGGCGFDSAEIDPSGGDASTGDTDSDSDGDTDSDTEGYDIGPIAVGPDTLSAGALHSCAVTEEGRLACWGTNRDGQSGGDAWVRFPAGIVDGFGADVAAVSAGGGHTCALTSAGGVLCMGMNWAGSLGTDQECPDGEDEDCVFHSPVAPVGLESGVASIHAGASHTCAVLESGEVVCFGMNWHGETGQPCEEESYENTLLPAPVDGLDAPAVDVAAGFWHTCALLENGEVMCWGWQHDGMLGDPSVPDGPTPTPNEVPGLSPGATALAVGNDHSCAIRGDGAVLCWGRCDYGGNCGTNVDSWLAASPVVVDGIPGTPVDVAVGDGYTCVLNAAGEVHCFGSGSASATLESLGEPYDDIVLHHQIAGLPDDVVDITGGMDHACALISDGRAFCWGQISQGQLGVMPVAEAFGVPGLEDGVSKLALGEQQVCGLLPAGVVRCFTFPCGDVAHTTDYDLGATEIAAGDLHACALDADGALLCWGDNNWSQLGELSDYFSEDPVAISGLPTGLVGITARGNATTALTDDGRVYFVGDYERIINVGEETVIRDPAPPLEIEALGAGNADVLDGNCAVCGDSDLTCITRSETSASLGLPFGVSASAASLAQGRWHACSITVSGAVLCAGENHYGQLGNGESWEGVGGPVSVDGLPAPALDVAVGSDHSCGLSETSGVQCWGWNVHGQLGDGTMLESHVPIPVTGIDGGAVEITSVDATTCALTSEGAVFCWGEHVYATYNNVSCGILMVALPVVGVP